MRIVYMGAGDIGLPTLRWLLDESEHEIVGVFTQTDKPVGRKQILTPPETKVLAEAAGVPVFQPERLRKNDQALADLHALKADVAVVMAYGQILPQAVIDAPAVACINLHASILPRHRGASPIQAAIRDGDDRSGITVMHIALKLDAGDMIHTEAIDLAIDETGGSLHDRLADLGPAALAKALPKLDQRSVQEEAKVTHCGKLTREDGEIDWSRPAEEIERLIRAYDPWPGTYTTFADTGQKLKVFPGGHQLKTGTRFELRAPVSDEGNLVIGCENGESALVLTPDTMVQMEGRKRVTVSDFLRGAALEGRVFR